MSAKICKLIEEDSGDTYDDCGELGYDEDIEEEEEDTDDSGDLDNEKLDRLESVSILIIFEIVVIRLSDSLSVVSIESDLRLLIVNAILVGLELPSNSLKILYKLKVFKNYLNKNKLLDDLGGRGPSTVTLIAYLYETTTSGFVSNLK